MTEATVVIPTKNAGSLFETVLDAVYEQSGEFEVLIVDSGSTDETLEIASRYPAKILEIDPESFGHGRTRNLAASRTESEYIVFLTQDAIPTDGWLEALLRPLRSDPEIAGTYSRQVPRDNATPMKEYFLREFYPPESERRSIASDECPTRDDAFFSNVSSAIRRTVWREIPFPEDGIMSEDQRWAKKVLLAGYSIRYTAESVVEHSHREGIMDILKRYFDSGASLSARELSSNHQRFLWEALSYQTGEWRYLVTTGRPHWLPYALFYDAAKFLGLQLGLREQSLPRWLKLRISDTLSRKYEISP